MAHRINNICWYFRGRMVKSSEIPNSLTLSVVSGPDRGRNTSMYGMYV